MDLLALIGSIVVVIALALGHTIDGGQLSSLLNGPAMLIVLGGSLGAIMIQVPMQTFRRSINMLWWIFFPPQVDYQASLQKVLRWSLISRREGVLGLDKVIHQEKDRFNRRALQMLIDGRSETIIRNTMLVELESYEDYEYAAAKVYESMGGYAPTIGILGAVMGLIHVMENLSDPTQLGSGIATAFVATVYGVGLANLVLIPVSKKLHGIISNISREKEMLLEGIICIAQGENPRNVAVRLEVFDRYSNAA